MGSPSVQFQILRSVARIHSLIIILIRPYSVANIHSLIIILNRSYSVASIHNLIIILIRPCSVKHHSNPSLLRS